MPPIQHLFVSFDAEHGAFRLPLLDVQEVIRLDGPFGQIDAGADTIAVRRRTVQMVDVNGWLGFQPSTSDRIVVFERNNRLHGLPISRMDRSPARHFRDLDLMQAPSRVGFS